MKNLKKNNMSLIGTHGLALVSLICAIFPSSAFAARIGIYGCIHGDVAMNQSVAKSMKTNRVTDIIANGDFTSGRVTLTDETLADMTSITGIDRDHFFIMPGNWDEEAARREDSYPVFEKYGKLVAKKYDGYGIIEVDGKKIQVAHFPQHPIPGQYLPPWKFLFAISRGLQNEKLQHQILTMRRKLPIRDDVVLNIYGHTHRRASFYDETGRLTINAGGLTLRKLPEEHRSYAVFDTKTEEVEFYDMEVNPPSLIEKVPVLDTEHLYERYDLQDFGTCRIPDNLITEFLEDYAGF